MIFLAFLALFNWYTAQHIADRWDWAQHHLVVFWVVSLAFFLLEMYWIASAFWFSGHRHSSNPAVKKLFVGFYYASFLALGIFSCQFLYTFMGDILVSVLKLAAPALAADVERYNLPVLCAMTFITILAGLFQVNTGPFVEMEDIPLKNLPPEFEGFRIVQISDLHLSPTIKRPYAEKVVHMVNELKPDLIALTGDFVDGTVDELRNDAAPLAQLSAPHGVWFVTGNHEYYWNPYAWMEEFRKLGARVLVNEHEIIRKGSDAIVLAGVSDYSTRHSNRPDAFSPKKALEGAPAGLVKILLAHQSVSYKEAHAAGFNLQLSGHTHAGQYFPYTLLIRFFQRYYKGLNNHDGMWVYVNTGTGYWGPPLRAGVPAEISLLTLTAAK